MTENIVKFLEELSTVKRQWRVLSRWNGRIRSQGENADGDIYECPICAVANDRLVRNGQKGRCSIDVTQAARLTKIDLSPMELMLIMDAADNEDGGIMLRSGLLKACGLA